MCGIVGYVGSQDAVPVLLAALRRLEYRGYDSAGLAIINGRGLELRRAPGKIAALETQVRLMPLHGRIGIGHTRWATHGRPTAANAHPHPDCGMRLAVVHNGIIENHRELRQRLIAEGHRFRSDTDTEVIAHLIESQAAHDLPEAVCRAARELRGTYAIACVAADTPDVLVAARGRSSPLIIGIGSGEMFLASDVPALAGLTEESLVLEEQEIAVIHPHGVSIRGLDGRVVARQPTRVAAEREVAERGGYPHFMLKEIFEQPDAIRRTLIDRVEPETGTICLPALEAESLTDRIRRLALVGCGTSWHAALVGKYLAQAFAKLPADATLASEFHACSVIDRHVLAVAISQSGETADTLAALRMARDAGAPSVAISNVAGSSLAREASSVIYTRAGFEIGVASTKAFTTQLAIVTLVGLKLGLARDRVEPALVRKLALDLLSVPTLMSNQLAIIDDRMRAIASRLVEARDVLYLGRGLHYPMALEGALKMKEISYVHAEGYAAGEMKHGPIALISRGTPVITVALRGPEFEKTMSNIQEVKARDALTIALTTDGDTEAAGLVDIAIPVPPVPYWIQPLVVAVPLQLVAYHLGVLRGCDVDQPRNLAKSVTVE